MERQYCDCYQANYPIAFWTDYCKIKNGIEEYPIEVKVNLLEDNTWDCGPVFEAAAKMLGEDVDDIYLCSFSPHLFEKHTADECGAICCLCGGWK